MFKVKQDCIAKEKGKYLNIYCQQIVHGEHRNGAILPHGNSQLSKDERLKITSCTTFLSSKCNVEFLILKDE